MLRLLIQLIWDILSCVEFWLANYSHETPLSGARLLKGLATELCGPSDRHVEALPLRHATRGLNTINHVKREHEKFSVQTASHQQTAINVKW